MKKIWIGFTKYKLIYIGFFVTVLFYVSAYQTRWFDYFFSGSSLHFCCKGLDFYQLPDGAYAFFHGGSLSGTMTAGAKPYSTGYYSNSNVYHPLFTLVLGTILMLFNAGNAFYLWMLAKLCITCWLVRYFYKQFKASPYVHLAIFVMLIDFAQYIEIRISQYQFVFNVFMLLLMINLVKNQGSQTRNGILYFLSLIVKPIGFLWYPLLFFRGQRKTLLLGLLLFILATAAFLFNHAGDYYTHNLVKRLFAPDTTGPIQVITLSALLRYSTPLSDVALNAIKFVCLGGTLLLSSLKRVHIAKAFYLMIVYYVLFADMVYEYYYTSLIVVLAVCLVSCADFQTRAARVFIIMLSLPSVFFILHFFHIGFVQDPAFGPDPTQLGWQLIVLSRILPVILLTGVVLRPEIRAVGYQLKRLLVNRLKVRVQVLSREHLVRTFRLRTTGRKLGMLGTDIDRGLYIRPLKRCCNQLHQISLSNGPESDYHCHAKREP